MYYRHDRLRVYVHICINYQKIHNKIITYMLICDSFNSEHIYKCCCFFNIYKSTGISSELPVVNYRLKLIQIHIYPPKKMMLHEFTYDLSIAQGLCYYSSII